MASGVLTTRLVDARAQVQATARRNPRKLAPVADPGRVKVIVLFSADNTPGTQSVPGLTIAPMPLVNVHEQPAPIVKLTLPVHVQLDTVMQ